DVVERPHRGVRVWSRRGYACYPVDLVVAGKRADAVERLLGRFVRSDGAEHHAMAPDSTRDRARVDARDTHDVLRLEVRVERPGREVVAGVARGLANDGAGNLYPRGFLHNRVGGVVADHGVGE